MAGNFIFTPGEEGASVDFRHLMVYATEYCYGWGIPADYQVIDTNALLSVLVQMRIDFPCKDGIDGSSPFKKAAQFVCHFMAMNPLQNQYSEEMVGADLAKISNNQNAMLALDFCLEALHGATLNHPDGDKCLENKINLSRHSYVDIVQSLSNVSAVAHFQLLCVFFEQMAYKENPKCQYELM